MSKENREREYNRLITLGKEDNIPQNLRNEFGDLPKKEVPQILPKETKKKKKR